MAKIANDKYYTEDQVAKYCVEKTYEVLGSDWDRVIEPSAGAGAYLKYLPEDTLAYDILPEAEGITTADYRTVTLPYMERSFSYRKSSFWKSK